MDEQEQMGSGLESSFWASTSSGESEGGASESSDWGSFGGGLADWAAGGESAAGGGVDLEAAQRLFSGDQYAGPQDGSGKITKDDPAVPKKESLTDRLTQWGDDIINGWRTGSRSANPITRILGNITHTPSEMNDIMGGPNAPRMPPMFRNPFAR